MFSIRKQPLCRETISVFCLYFSKEKMYIMLSHEVFCLFMKTGEEQIIVIKALINKNIDLKEGVLTFSHDCM